MKLFNRIIHDVGGSTHGTTNGSIHGGSAHGGSAHGGAHGVGNNSPGGSKHQNHHGSFGSKGDITDISNRTHHHTRKVAHPSSHYTFSVGGNLSRQLSDDFDATILSTPGIQTPASKTKSVTVNKKVGTIINHPTGTSRRDFIKKVMRMKTAIPAIGPPVGIADAEARTQIYEFLSKYTKELNALAPEDDENSCLEDLERIITSFIDEDCEDIDLIHALESCGWNGNRFKLPESKQFDPNALMLALANLYLTTGRNAIADRHFASSLASLPIDAHEDLYGGGRKYSGDKTVNFRVKLGSSPMERSMQTVAKAQIESFCPNILLKFLESRILNQEPLESVSTPIQAVCMLCDISGFSKFSGQLCALGVNGLKQVHQATTDFLGYFVDVIYKHGGDGKFLSFPF